MFRIESLILSGHPKLGDISLNFFDTEDEIDLTKPFTSVIIGPNGTGKSFILRTIADIFRQFKAYSISEKREFSLPYDIHLRYRFYHNTYEIVTRKSAIVGRSQLRDYYFYKNRPLEIELNTQTFTLKKTGYEITHKELEFPEHLLVNSIIPTDRFSYFNSKRVDFYQYLGARSTSTSTSTKSSVRRTLRHLFNAASENLKFKNNLKELLDFLEFEQSFVVEYNTKINKLFFSSQLTIENFRKYFEYWWDEDFEFSKRKKENPLWSIPYYNQHFKSNNELTIRIIEYLKKIASTQEYLKKKKNSTSKTLSIDLLADYHNGIDLEMIAHLENLDIINLAGIQMRKSDKALSISDISSGEYHLLISLISIFTNVSKDSLILIDEPEISLHPNWQMQYITFLKNVFSKFPSCHFILTTHSHFLISDLESSSSSVIALNRTDNYKLTARLLKDAETFGSSAEEILYNIFNLKTVRNHFIQADITDLLGLISENSKDKKRIQKLIDSLKQISTSPNDPLNVAIEEAIDYQKRI